MTDRTQTTSKPFRFGPSRLEADVIFSDGTVHKVTGLFAVEYHKDPARIGPQIERIFREDRKRDKLAADFERHGFGRIQALHWANALMKEEIQRD